MHYVGKKLVCFTFTFLSVKLDFPCLAFCNVRYHKVMFPKLISSFCFLGAGLSSISIVDHNCVSVKLTDEHALSLCLEFASY